MNDHDAARGAGRGLDLDWRRPRRKPVQLHLPPLPSPATKAAASDHDKNDDDPKDDGDNVYHVGRGLF
jgi:hypothetical protein